MNRIIVLIVALQFSIFFLSCNLLSPSPESQYKLSSIREGGCDAIIEIDINHDGYQEILIGTYSPDHGITFNPYSGKIFA